MYDMVIKLGQRTCCFSGNRVTGLASSTIRNVGLASSSEEKFICGLLFGSGYPMDRLGDDGNKLPRLCGLLDRHRGLFIKSVL